MANFLALARHLCENHPCQRRVEAICRNEAWQAVKDATRHMKGASIQMLYRAAEGMAVQALRDLGVPMG